MVELHTTDLNVYRKPRGWVDFWVGLIVFIAVGLFFGRIMYMEEMVKRGDKAYRQSISETNPKNKIDED